MPGNLLQPLLDRLSCHSELTEAEAATIREIPATLQFFDQHAVIQNKAAKLGFLPIVKSGFVSRYKLTGKNRQILGFAIAGDVLGYGGLLADRLITHARAQTQSEILWIEQTKLDQAFLRSPGLARAFWRQSLVDSSVLAEWIANVGHRRARERTGFLLLELYERLRHAGYRTPFRLPLTQVDIADALGLSLVHVNKSIQSLKAEGLVRITANDFEILDHATLVKTTNFDPAYLFLTSIKPIDKEPIKLGDAHD